MKPCALLSLAALPLLPFLTTSCEKKTTVVAVEGSAPVLLTAVEQSIQSQVEALNREDLPAYMSYLHPDNVGFAEAEVATRKLFADYELKTTLEKLEPVTVTDGEAKIKFTQLTQKVTGPAFRDNRVTGVHTLRKDAGLWKIYATAADGIVYLDGAP